MGKRLGIIAGDGKFPVLLAEDITEAIMAGGISKRFMFSDIKPDLRALSLLIRLKDRKDDTILRAIAEELEKEGITVNKATTYIESILAEKETLTKRKLSRDEKKDIDFGFDIAQAIGRLDIGQCGQVKK